MQAHTLPPAIPLSAVRILPGSLPPGAHVLVYVPAHAPAAGKLLTAQLRRVLADRVIAPGAVVRVDADTTVQVLLVDGSAAAATLVYVTRQTEFVFTAAPNVPNAEAAAVSEPEMAFPGLEAEFASLVELIRLPLQHAAGFARLGISPPAGVLLHGPPGTGKTMLVWHGFFLLFWWEEA
jgi:ATP-dependent 26S proteasome regulatory subunit